MIGKLSGILIDKTPPMILLDVGGVGYEIDVPMSTFYHLPDTGESVSLFSHLIVRDDAMLLFGFGTEAERRLFRLLIKVSGISARIALGLLSGLSVDQLIAAVGQQDHRRLTQIPGIGKKTAERLLFELRDKLAVLPLSKDFVEETPSSVQGDILNALISLGYSEREAMPVVRGLPTTITVADGIRAALQQLSAG
jgi:Holliday junction DNA helicase RuvA